jgi:hypothetical protein
MNHASEVPVLFLEPPAGEKQPSPHSKREGYSGPIEGGRLAILLLALSIVAFVQILARLVTFRGGTRTDALPRHEPFLLSHARAHRSTTVRRTSHKKIRIQLHVYRTAGPTRASPSLLREIFLGKYPARKLRAETGQRSRGSIPRP